MTEHKVVSRAEWQTARDELLQREKEHTKMADELARQRRELPWVTIDKEYRLDTDDGTRTLAELFDGRCSTTSCSDRATRRGARSTHPWPMASTASCRTCTPA